jgi:hypothetical protein
MSDPSAPMSERSTVKQETLLSLANQIETAINFKERLVDTFPGSEDPQVREARLNVLDFWQNLFKEEIASVMLLRNSVAHGVPVPEKTLDEGIEAETQLIRFLNSRLLEPEVT